jgi:hypothetical protein
MPTMLRSMSVCVCVVYALGILFTTLRGNFMAVELKSKSQRTSKSLGSWGTWVIVHPQSGSSDGENSYPAHDAVVRSDVNATHVCTYEAATVRLSRSQRVPPRKLVRLAVLHTHFPEYLQRKPANDGESATHIHTHTSTSVRTLLEHSNNGPGSNAL